MLNSYYNLNYDGFRKIIKKFNKICKKVKSKMHTDLGAISFKNLLMKSTVREYKFKLDIIQKKVEENFIQTFYQKNLKEGNSEIQKIQRGRLISQRITFLLGLYMGLAWFMGMIILIVGYQQRVLF